MTMLKWCSALYHVFLMCNHLFFSMQGLLGPSGGPGEPGVPGRAGLPGKDVSTVSQTM